MDANKNEPNSKFQPQPYSKPALTMFGDVRSLTANGTLTAMEDGKLMQMG